jgi:hypothetical protein
MVYKDDILVFSRTAEEHLKHVKLILAQLRQHQLFAKRSKCEFNRASLPFLVHVVGQGGVVTPRPVCLPGRRLRQAHRQICQTHSPTSSARSTSSFSWSKYSSTPSTTSSTCSKTSSTHLTTSSTSSTTSSSCSTASSTPSTTLSQLRRPGRQLPQPLRQHCQPCLPTSSNLSTTSFFWSKIS